MYNIRLVINLVRSDTVIFYIYSTNVNKFVRKRVSIAFGVNQIL